MPFDSMTGAAAGKKGVGKNRWKGKDPSTNRTEKFLTKVTPSELEMMETKAAKHGLSRTELIVQAVRSYPD